MKAREHYNLGYDAHYKWAWNKGKNSAYEEFDPRKSSILSQVAHILFKKDHNVPSLLHLEIGMINHAWDNFKNWMDDSVDMIPPYEQDSQKKTIGGFDKILMMLLTKTKKKKKKDIFDFF